MNVRAELTLRHTAAGDIETVVILEVGTEHSPVGQQLTLEIQPGGCILFYKLEVQGKVYKEGIVGKTNAYTKSVVGCILQSIIVVKEFETLVLEYDEGS